jgi:hypothetical protein
MEIGTSSKIPIMPSMVQLVTKTVNPVKGGTSLEIIPLPIQTFIIHVIMTTIGSKHVEGSERYDKEQVELNPSFTILS